MSAAFLAGAAAELGLLLRATLLIGAAWAGAAALRKAGASASARHLAWLLGIAALLALPLLWWLAPALRLPFLLPEAAVPAAAALAPPTEAAGSVPAGSPQVWEWSAVLLAAWAIGAGLLLLRIAIFRRMLSRLWRDAEPARDAAWQGLLDRVSREMLLSRPVELRIARGPAMPMTWGTLAPKLLLPAEAEAWPPEQRRLVLLHELAHVARRDSLSRSAASLACALYWFHPGAWFAARQMRIEQEHAADDRVLNAGAPARSYALSLVHLARGIGERSRFGHAAAMAGMCQLERRLVSITTPTPRELPGAGFLAASVAIASVVALVVAAGVPVRPAPLPDSLGAQPALLVPVAGASADPARREGVFGSQAQAATRAEAASAGDGGSRDRRDGLASASFMAPQAQSGGRAPDGTEQRDAAPPQSPQIVLRPGEPMVEAQAPAARRQIAAYGPSLPQPDSGADADARIPELARRPARGDPDDRGTRRALPDTGIWFEPDGTVRLSPEMNLVRAGIALLAGRDGQH